MQIFVCHFTPQEGSWTYSAYAVILAGKMNGRSAPWQYSVSLIFPPLAVDEAEATRLELLSVPTPESAEGCLVFLCLLPFLVADVLLL